LLDDARHSEYDQEAEDAFNKEFAKMLADTTDTRRIDRKTAPPVFDTAVPLIKRAHLQDDNQPSDGKHMQFSLLSKKGNKQQVRLSVQNR
jgi:regulator of nonsense transcripts 2